MTVFSVLTRDVSIMPAKSVSKTIMHKTGKVYDHIHVAVVVRIAATRLALNLKTYRICCTGQEVCTQLY